MGIVFVGETATGSLSDLSLPLGRQEARCLRATCGYGQGMQHKQLPHGKPVCAWRTHTLSLSHSSSAHDATNHLPDNSERDAA